MSYKKSAVIYVLPAFIILFTYLSITALTAKDDAHANSDQIERGKYLATISGCGDCHSPKVFSEKGMHEDSTRLLSGHPEDSPVPEVPSNVLAPDKWIAITNAHQTAWAGPWGISFGSNLTPDERTGMGAWTEDLFVETIRTGKHLGFGRQIQPPMPWYNFAQMTDEDLKAIFAYLMSLPPIENEVPIWIEPGEKK